MRRKLLGAIFTMCIGWFQAEASTDPTIMTDPKETGNLTAATLSCNLTNPSSSIKGHYWTRNGKIIDKSESTSDQPYTEYRIEKIDYHYAGIYECVFRSEPQVNASIEVKAPPHVVAYKHSENANEKDKAVLICVSHGYPMYTDWTWSKISEDDSVKGAGPITNGTDDKYEIKNTPNKTTLYIKDLNIENDMGIYECRGTNVVGTGQDQIQLRVRSQLAALWPFLGIVAEVIILVTIIFIYEKKRKPDEITDDDDSGAAPLKSNAATNHKDKNVRQRNSN
ncbi:basigin isoform X1 [Pseudorasbora parva]|uniref:basigin isoform X1 n=1 Tax=Pseudorasbora parva TaxID=51549 RepID=UPI00351E69BF